MRLFHKIADFAVFLLLPLTVSATSSPRNDRTSGITSHLKARTVRSPGKPGKKYLEAPSDGALETDILAENNGNIISALKSMPDRPKQSGYP